MAPELLNEDEYGAPADVWALGVTLLRLATGHLVGRTLNAMRALLRGTWSLPAALAGEYLDKFHCPEEGEWWTAARAEWAAAWTALSSELQDVISSCLTLDAGARATAGTLLGHAAFRRERSAALLSTAGVKLAALLAAEAAGGAGAAAAAAAAASVSPEELLAVLQAGPAAPTPSAAAELQRACGLVEGAAGAAGEAWATAAGAALLDVVGGAGSGSAACVAAAAAALQGLQGVAGARELTREGAAALLGAARRLAGELAGLEAGGQGGV